MGGFCYLYLLLRVCYFSGVLPFLLVSLDLFIFFQAISVVRDGVF